MTTLRKAAQQALEALYWCKPSALIGPGGIAARKQAIATLRAALALPDRTGSQHCERMCEAEAFKIEIRRLKAALAQEEDTRVCTCHPDDNPPVPCAKKYALTECRKAALAQKEQDPVAWMRRDGRLALHDGGIFDGDWTPLYKSPFQPGD